MNNNKPQMADHTSKRKLGELLRNINLLTQEQIDQALLLQKEHGIKFGDAVTRLGFLTKDDINWALSAQLNIPYIPPRELENAVDPVNVFLLPYEFAKKHAVLVIGMVLDAVNIAIADPLNLSVIEDIEKIIGKEVNVSISDELAILDMIETLYKDRPDPITEHHGEGIVSQIKIEINNVIRDIGPGFDAGVYKNAVCRAFDGRTTKDVTIPLFYKDAEIGGYPIDILIDNSIGVLFNSRNMDDNHIQSVIKLSGLKGVIFVRVTDIPSVEELQ